MKENGKGNNSPELRKTFIAMLFALAVAALADQFSNLLYVLTNGWNDGLSPVLVVRSLFEGEAQLLAPFLHSLLAFSLVVSSWVGWSNSLAGGHQRKVERFLSGPFFLLLFEVALVTLYFALVNANELDFDSYLPIRERNDFVVSPSAIPEATILFWVFAIYVFWDIWADVLTSDLKDNDHSKNEIKVHPLISGILTYCLLSIICTIACYILIKNIPDIETAVTVSLSDLGLLVVILFFRTGKCLEFYMQKIFPTESSRKNTPRTAPKLGDWILMAIQLISFALLIWLI